MRVLVACEYSGRVRDAFRRLGHDAWSCDLLDSEEPSRYHLKGDVREWIELGCPPDGHKPYQYWIQPWDMMIAHPPCTHLAVSGSRHFAAKKASGVQDEALEFVRYLLNAPIERIALENPVSIISSRIRKPDQTIQPWQFGHGETKATCLWLKNLPLLVPTHKEGGDMFTDEAPVERVPRVHLMPPGPNRWKERSRTYLGVANAMANQWGYL